VADVKPLEIFMDEAARTPFSYGAHDCLLFLADWVSNVRGIDPAEDLRGIYRSRGGYMRVLLQHGGVMRLVTSRAERAGCKRTDEPKRGDIGLMFAVVERGAPQLVGAICCGERWIMLGKRGVLGAAGVTPARAWRV
jgi:hypothetical protein